MCGNVVLIQVHTLSHRTRAAPLVQLMLARSCGMMMPLLLLLLLFWIALPT